ncbi:hypothetical protein, partial [Natronomonas sp.]|uniref:hypothetical protein n=1 Tax=Natronomonas sp. TaxID=2184060 RepID=UPI00397485C4
SKNDLHNLSDNIITAMDAILAITDPVIMKKVTLFAGTFRELDQKSVPEYSMQLCTVDRARSTPNI